MYYLSSASFFYLLMRSISKVKNGTSKNHYLYRINSNLAISIYEDSRPRNLEIAEIQKSLVLVKDGKELIEEGAGFGLPVVRYKEKSVFPSSARLKIISIKKQCCVIEKTYFMNAISVKVFRNSLKISDRVYKPIHKCFETSYLRLRSFRPIFDRILLFRTLIGVKTTFKKIRAKGFIKIRYTIKENTVKINAFTHMEPGYLEVVFLNEQGGNTFRKYTDINSILIDQEIGAWTKVDVKNATFSDLKDEVSFTVTRPENTGFYRGREFIQGRLSWAGLAVSFNSFNRLEYNIGINENF
jgi:hypothetical protein